MGNISYDTSRSFTRALYIYLDVSGGIFINISYAAPGSMLGVTRGRLHDHNYFSHWGIIPWTAPACSLSTLAVLRLASLLQSGRWKTQNTMLVHNMV